MLGNLTGGNKEERAISFQSIWGAGDSFAFTTQSGANIDQQTSMQINAFYACVLLISDTISTLPVDSFIRRDGDRVPYRPQPSWIQRPDVDLLRTEHYQQVLISLLLDGNAFIRIYRDNSGQVANLVVIDPSRVEVTRTPVTREVVYIIDQNQDFPVYTQDMLQITEMRKAGELRGMSRVTELKDNLGLSSALQSFAARFFGQGATTSGIIETPMGLNSEQAKQLVEGFDGKHRGYRKAHKTGILTGGAKFVRTGVNPDEAQMLDSQKFAVEQIARIFRVPPHMIGVTTAGAMSYNSVEQQNINFVTHTLRPYIAKMEDAYSTLLPQGAFIRFNVDGLLRGDFSTRMQGYSIGSQAGFLSVNDIRRFEDLRPVEGGDVYRVPLANVDLGAASLVETDKRVTMASKLILAGFDPAGVLAALDLPKITHSGVPSVQLQSVAQIDPEAPESVYDVQRTHDVNVQMPETIVNVPPAVINVAPPNITVEAPQQRTTIRTVERDDNGHIVNIIERVEN
jgi:HK97 family phage portal protein